MKNRKDLISKTNEFFRKHWNIDQPPPTWSVAWEWVGSIPNYNLGGVYALFRKDEFIYLGLGASRGNARYPDSGLSRRLMSHVYRSAPKGSLQNLILRERWVKAGLTSISTIGLPSEFNYLASALEDFLIGELNPLLNDVKRKNR